jgi:hypothetical protein
MECAPPVDVPLALAALRQRVGRELARMSGAAAVGTEFVGGWARVGMCLDALLRNAFSVLCLGAQRSVDSEFQRWSRQPTWQVARATAGQFRYVLPGLARELGTRDPLLRAVVAACEDSGSPLRRAIEVRNAMVHGHPTPPAGTLRSLLAELLAWCEGRGPA